MSTVSISSLRTELDLSVDDDGVMHIKSNLSLKAAMALSETLFPGWYLKEMLAKTKSLKFNGEIVDLEKAFQ